MKGTFDKTLGVFEYSNRIRIYWLSDGYEHKVVQHEQLDYEELCFEHTQPEIFTFVDVSDARDKFADLSASFMLKWW
jgi:hypothetical protein